eukprot:6463676-Amphidinium_carterae.4
MTISELRSLSYPCDVLLVMMRPASQTCCLSFVLCKLQGCPKCVCVTLCVDVVDIRVPVLCACLQAFSLAG